MNCTASQNNLLAGWMPKRKVLSFRPDASLEAEFLRAMKATHCQAQEILAECVRASLAQVTNRMIAERRRAEADFLNESPPPYHTGKRKAG